MSCACTSRRQALGRISSAAVAAMAGVALWPETPVWLPVAEASGAPAAPGKKK